MSSTTVSTPEYVNYTSPKSGKTTCFKVVNQFQQKIKYGSMKGTHATFYTLRGTWDGASSFPAQAVHCSPCEKPAPSTPKPNLTGLAGVAKLFDHARKHLKHPKVRLLVKSQPVCLSPAGPKSKYAGQVMVTDGAKYPNNQYYGRITEAGDFFPGKACTDEVKALLTELGSNPTEVALKYGKLTGNCCFCGKGLDTPESTSVGYGPVCAKVWQLPWGKFMVKPPFPEAAPAAPRTEAKPVQATPTEPVKINQELLVETCKLTWHGESKTFTVEASDLQLKALPKAIAVRSSTTGAMKAFEFKQTHQAGEEIACWDYTCGDFTLKIFND